ncbi:MAG: DUF3489 domain-containing protein [Pseudomonadota bacterium]
MSKTEEQAAAGRVNAPHAGSARKKKQTARKTKREQLVRLLGGKSGADIASLCAKLGWQPHTTRAATTGLRKAGYEIKTERANDGRPARYRIVSAPAPAG